MLRRSLLASALIAGALVMAGPADAVIGPDVSCRSGPVSITFDDGPNKINTPRLLSVLRANHAQATFFVEGQYAKRYPALLRAEISDGHAVENHSWDHPQLSHLSNSAITSQIARTTTQIVRAIGIRPEFMRPPYGDTNPRVRSLIAGQHLVQELWTIDTNDWRGGGPAQITRAALSGLHAHRSNVILMHDGVTNSPRTIQAVPAIIRGLRARGYCLVPLQVTAPLSRVSAAPVTVDAGTTPSKTVTVTFKLNTPSQRPASFRIRTVDGTAKKGKDYTALTKVLAVKRGATSVSVALTIFADPLPAPARTFTLVLDRANNIAVATPTVAISVTDDHPSWAATRAVLISSG